MTDRERTLPPSAEAYWSFDEGSGDTVRESISGRERPVKHALADAEHHDAVNPRWIEGISGTALVFDGYSTYVEYDGSVFDGDVPAFAVEAWVAPRAFEGRVSDRCSAVVSSHSCAERRGFEFGLDGHGRCTAGVGLGDTWTTATADEPLAKYEWSHVVAAFDGADGALDLYVNGGRRATSAVPAGSSMTAASVPIRIGKNTVTEQVGEAFALNAFGGAIDELRILDSKLDGEDVRKRYETEGGDTKQAADGVALDPARYEGDPHRPQYHPIPPGHWMNEPHAPLYHRGQYHLFYQHNPSGPYWGNIHWGHWVSDDLVHWRHRRPALAPEPDGLAPDGVWSGGSTHDADGEPVLFATAGDLELTPDQRIATARPTDPSDPDLTEWQLADEPAIERPSGIGLRPNDFRDPFVWEEDGTWFCLVGSGFEDGGAALLYESTDLEAWEFRGCLHRSDHDEHPELGLVWELPVLLPVGEDATGTEKHVFLVSPIEGDADVEVYYWLGEWDPDVCAFDPDHEDPRLIDYGDFHFTGPHGMVDPETGRSILFTIAQDNRRPHHHHDCGWAHNGGLPLHLSLRDDGRLGIEPIEELESLRTERLARLRDVPVSTANADLAGVGGRSVELQARMSASSARRYGLKVGVAPDGSEETLIQYDDATEQIVVDREQSTRDTDMLAAVSERSSLVHSGDVAFDDELQLHVYVDGSMLEVYVNGHRSVTTRLYPVDEESVGIELWADGDATVHSLDIWQLESAYR